MQRNLPSLADGVFDLLIVGGGIFGAGVARDAAMRGLRTALVEKNDFASGTSSRSSKLIHGGFRYLEQHDFRLVAESSRERRILRRIAPHRVKPLAMLLPVYETDARPLWLLRLGMTLYDVLAMYRNVAPHRTLSAEAAMELEPSLRGGGLRGAIRFFDCQEDDARFCIDNILHAAQLGAACANYCEVIGFNQEDGAISSARVRDALGGAEFDIRARVFINAAGPWVEQVGALLGEDHGSLPRLSPTKGVHLLLPKLTQSHAIFFQGRKDGRMMFVIPWLDCSMAGTTDTDFHGDAALARPDDADVEYLLDEARALFPGRNLTASDIITTFAGVRPLLASDAANPSARSRDHQILQAGKNLLSLAGGKYTTYRLVAQQTINEACRLLGVHPPPCRTARTPIPDFRPPSHGEKIADFPEVYASDVEFAVREEMAITVEDVMRRRTGLTLSRYGVPEVAKAVGRIMESARCGFSSV